ncbi:MAG: ParB N-terminal domain-containing protein [Burkholderiaceae bacterium]|nr:ParB N-terminal domain-containing protein [Burkholderiaceae bacterium]
MSGEALHKGIANGEIAGPSARHVTIEERRRLVAESLRVGNPGNNSRELPTHADPRHECQIELAVDDIRPYENNPRRAANARFAEIRESIRSSGMRNPLTVTRRPGEAHFIVEAGGNTRLLAIQQLWSETKDARFRKLVVLFRPWRSESHVLTSHLIENELRGEMTFWDKAAGVVALKARLEAERGEALSLRQLEDEMKGFGLAVNTATLAHCLFAIERLRTLGEAVDDLSGLDVKTLQPRLNAMKRYAQVRAALDEADLYATVFEPVFQNAALVYRQSRAFSASEVCGACEEALARRLGESVTQARLAPGAPLRSPQASSQILPAPAGTATPVESAAMAPIAVRDAPRSDRAVSTANKVNTALDRPADPPPPTGANVALRSRIVEHVQSFAALAGIAECLRLHVAAPLGYFMEALPVAGEENSRPPSRRQAWSVLAVIAGQIDPPISVAAPDGATQADPDRSAGSRENPSGFDAAFVQWLIDAADDASVALWNLLALAREFRAPTSLPRGSTRAISAAGEA